MLCCIMHSYFVFLLCLFPLIIVLCCLFVSSGIYGRCTFLFCCLQKERKKRKLSSCYKFCDRASSGRNSGRQNIVQLSSVFPSVREKQRKLLVDTTTRVFFLNQLEHSCSSRLKGNDLLSHYPRFSAAVSIASRLHFKSDCTESFLTISCILSVFSSMVKILLFAAGNQSFRLMPSSSN